MRSLIAALVLCFAFPLAALAQRPALVDRIVAVVNKEAITLSELDDQVAMAERQLERQGTPLPNQADLERLELDLALLVGELHREAERQPALAAEGIAQREQQRTRHA